MTKARQFPDNTCPASRHSQRIAEVLMGGNGKCQMIDDDPAHCGESIAATVTALWKARTEVERLKDALRHVQMTMGPTDPPCCAGCRHEWAEVLRTVGKVLGPNFNSTTPHVR